MKGHVEDGRAWVTIPLLHAGRRLIIDFQIDTGFAGWVAMPPASVESLGLPYVDDLTSHLVDGSRAETDVHAAVIEWFGIESTVPVMAIGQRPLVGAAMLNGCELVVEYRRGGEVRLTPL